MASSTGFAARTAVSPLLWRVPILTGCIFEEGQPEKRFPIERITGTELGLLQTPHHLGPRTAIQA